MGLAAVPFSAYKLGIAGGALRSAMQSLQDCQGYLKFEYAKATTPEQFMEYTKAEMAAFRKIRDGINELWPLIEWEAVRNCASAGEKREQEGLPLFAGKEGGLV
jgi:hypothetical protein